MTIKSLLVLLLWSGAGHVLAATTPPPSDAEFIRAVDSANEVQVKRLLDQGANPNALDDRGEPALIYALHAERFETADVLADWPGTNIEAENKQGQTALMVAAFIGRQDLVERLLARGAEVSHSGWTALHYAASTGQLEIVRLLLEKSAYIDALSANGTTPLMMAARHKDQPVCQLLLDEGADPTLKNGADLSAAEFARRAGDAALGQALDQASIAFAARRPARVLPLKGQVSPLAPSDAAPVQTK